MNSICKLLVNNQEMLALGGFRKNQILSRRIILMVAAHIHWEKTTNWHVGKKIIKCLLCDKYNLF